MTVDKPYGISLIFFLIRASEADVHPTCPPILVTALFPNTIELLKATLALYPIAVAFVRSAKVTSAPYPMAVLLCPVEFLSNVLFPTAVL